jgi:hypothetical protein
VWCSDDNAVLHQKLRPGIADRIAPLLADIIGQGVQEGVFTVAYPDQMGRVIVALIQDLNDRPAELVLTAESGPRTLPTVEHTMLMIVLIAFCLQGLVKFAVWFLVGCDADQEDRLPLRSRWPDHQLLRQHHVDHHGGSGDSFDAHRDAVPQFHYRPGRRHADHPGLLPPLQQATDRGQDA